ncbi:TVP38/TMEM64 family protein [Thiobacillus sedimenti]|uniref:TVP38/TMEM64 family membrane protein n=1 Tax=Thiobacillus sedimenti TaxID=3110231 RepID=A0ABZ1CMT1_9PROT|nr:VTT domain-containing protein [Thiobacillus sp. SCUT-2]WRS40340.1 VTT domain-containing protein [Thiobacillus sp. SCUT-2]
MKARVVLKGLALMLSLALLGYLFESSDLGNSVNEAWIDTRVRGHGVSGALLFLLMGGLFTAIGLPRQIIAFLGGYAFNVGLGTLVGALAALLGCMLSFGYARLFGQGLLRARLGERAGRFDRFIQNHPFSMTVLVRLLPVGNNLLTNLAAGISSIPAVRFFAGTLLGYLPQTLVFALVGSGAHIDPALKLALAIGLFLVSGALGAYLYRRFRHGQSLDDQVDAALDETGGSHDESRFPR